MIKRKKLMVIMMLISIIFSAISNIFAKTEISSANLYNKGECGYHLQYWNASKNAWYYVLCYYTAYSENGREYPAYCVNKEYDGVGELPGYEVDINTILENEVLWRTIINGFPYKTATQLGLNNDYDAYIATKQAVYCILYNRDVRGFYRGGDSIGNAIVNAMDMMVNEGRYGTQTRKDGSITTTRAGGLYEEGNYYVQKYNVKSNVDMASYLISATANMPTGTIITNSGGAQTSNYNGSESFFVKIPKTSMNTNIDIVINLQGKCKTYPVFYGETRIPETQNYAVAYDPYGDGVGRANLNIKSNTAKLEILKVDEETNKGLQGVTFEVKKTSGELIGNYTTDVNGRILISDLYQGEYIVKETKTLEEYIINPAQNNVTLEFEKTSQLKFTNKHKKGNLKVFKVDKDDNRIALGGIEFDLIDSKGNIIKHLVTNADGEIYIENLNTGAYILKETKTKAEYELVADVGTTIEWDKTTNVTVENEKKKGQIKVIKVDKDNNEIKIAGVTFEVYDRYNGKFIEKIITDSNGVAITSKLPLGDYIVKETNTLDYYELSNEEKIVTVERNSIKDIVFENELKKGQIKVVKVDKDNNSLLLEGVKFNIIDNKNNQIIDTIITGNDGTAITKRLPINSTYTIKEIETDEKYELNLEDTITTIEWNKTTDLTIENEKKKGQIKVIKVDLDNNEIKIPNVKFEVLDKDMKFIEEIITNINGEAVTSRLPAIDEVYYLRETETLDNYVLNTEVKQLIIEPDKINDIVFANEKIKGKIKIIKSSDEDNQYSELPKDSLLEGAIFEIYDERNNLVDTVTTDKTGTATSKILLKGIYYIKEIKAPKYYIINENIFNTEIKIHTEIVDVNVKNDNVNIDVEVHKNGFIETQDNDTIYYNFKDIKNNSNVYLDNFTWQDTLPTNALRADKIYTGTWNQDLKYSIWYKTNINDYKLLKQDLSTQVNYEVNFTDINLLDEEYITEFEFRFGKVDIGFKEIDSPILYCKMIKGLGNGFVFINRTKVSGTYYDKYVEDVDKWTTITYFKEIKLNKLPKTGIN